MKASLYGLRIINMPPRLIIATELSGPRSIERQSCSKYCGSSAATTMPWKPRPVSDASRCEAVIIQPPVVRL